MGHQGASGDCSLRCPLPVLTAPRQVIALLELPTMQLAGDEGPAMAVDTMREVDTAHAHPTVVTAFEPPLVQIAPLLHVPPCKYICTSTGRGGSASYPQIYPQTVLSANS